MAMELQVTWCTYYCMWLLWENAER